VTAAPSEHIHQAAHTADAAGPSGSGCQPVGRRTVRALIPCFNRPADLRWLLDDLRSTVVPSGVRLSVLVVDNASDPPLCVASVPSLAVECLRLPVNTGGSGGFNAGLTHVMACAPDADEGFLWLLDSDARVEPGAMAALLEAMDARPDAVVAGSALARPDTGEVFELGGTVDIRTGEYRQLCPVGADEPVEADYVAACSLLVRREAVERAGVMADMFINGDDVEWCLRLSQRTGGRILAVPASRARHPHPDKMRTWDRYYAARNAFCPIERLHLGALTRFRRAMRETGRSVSQALGGRHDLADLHIRGLRDALAGRTSGPAPAALEFEPFRPSAELAGAIGELATGLRGGSIRVSAGLADDRVALDAIRSAHIDPVIQPAPGSTGRALARVLLGTGESVAVVSARGRPNDWSPARVLVSIAPQGFVIIREGRGRRLIGAGRVLARGAFLAVGLSLRGPGAAPRIPAAPAPARPAGASLDTPGVDLTIVVLSHNRWPALSRTLSALRTDSDLRGAAIIVVDNASSDASAAMAGQHHPDADVVALSDNTGVAGFNRGVERADRDFVLILDDDATPAPATIAAAMALLRRRPDLGAVVLHPRHPATGASEWTFAPRAASIDDWPVMGCANLVRTAAWRQVGGYEESFFLYRNDTDLAMKLAGAGWGVHFNPEWVAWHDSPAAARKSARWFELATRNWVWVCRRHGSGPVKLGAILAGWAWAHRQAGLSAGSHWRVLRGVAQGLLQRPAPLPPVVRPDGAALRRLMRMRFGRGGH
jgi:GT2 family glycosyltransferase